MDKQLIQEIIKFGKKLTQYGFVYAHFGNISVRSNNKLLITKRGSMLDELKEEDIIEVDIEKPSDLDDIASSELKMHRSIYLNTDINAIIHTHSLFSVIVSMNNKRIIHPIDEEGKLYLKEIPIVQGKPGSFALAKNCISAINKNYKGIIIRDHGCVAVNKTLEKAFYTICMIEHSCKIIYYSYGRRRMAF
jgi:L-fuculose-phosphate aldolase